MKLILSSLFICLMTIAFGQGNYQLAVLKYNGGGDYYANPTSVPNLVKFANQEFKAGIDEEVPYVEVGSPLIFTYPFVHMTGHGNVVFSNSERENLRNYLIGGGFLHVDDNYGMDEFIRPEIEKLFPNLDMVELPYDHAIFKQKFTFNGLPKIHEHDGERPQAFGILIEGRLALLYTYETDLGDGWEDITVHNNTQENHEKALKMGINILQFALLKGGLE
ncbi:hypothetical protein CW751_13285 [Brumimicrobium salinarum]|uniref:DUF4159 domain-containing protein n=1 Tax=Brumimicrobium salinarum TaxID=2058658 RepID=A0A2I0QZV0_9FLAO|nr:DUF4159 domain-containing protein [Brumimicrobium salinarum]PKR79825.1 hypothetical protein CW751_13285 [Brumimicrobium salinarum]